ncbi:MAG: molybdopterin converting factor subunit 1, partial [Sandaracinaceae bacterium]
MRIEMLYFAALRDLRGVASESLELPAEVNTVAALRGHLEALHPALAGRLGTTRFARNEQFAQEEEPLEEGDIVALIPPVAGGAGLPQVADRVAIRSEPLSLDDVSRLVRRPEAGALAVFVGVVRDHHAGEAVSGLEYSAYESMARAEMIRVVEEIEAEIEGAKLAVHHRVGKLAIGDDA